MSVSEAARGQYSALTVLREMRMPTATLLLLIADLIDTFVFALSGAAAAMRADPICSVYWPCRSPQPIPAASPATC